MDAMPAILVLGSFRRNPGASAPVVNVPWLRHARFPSTKRAVIDLQCPRNLPEGDAMTLDKPQIAAMLRSMVLIREFDELAVQLRVAGRSTARCIPTSARRPSRSGCART